jgi:hypothetical protein
MKRALWLLFALYVAALLVALGGMRELPSVPLDITIDGRPLLTGFDPGVMALEHQVLLAAGLALLAVLIVLLVITVVLPAVLLAVAVSLLLATVVILAVLSPLIALVWLGWRAVASRRRSSTMAA